MRPKAPDEPDSSKGARPSDRGEGSGSRPTPGAGPFQEGGPFQIVTLAPLDYDELVGLWHDAKLPYRPAGRDAREAIAAQMALPHCRFFGVRSGTGELLGAAIANHEGRKGWINRIAVRPAARRSGVARILVEACEDWLFGDGILLVAALIEGPNRASQSLFSACGYERDDTLVYFRKAKEPSV